MRAHQDGNLRRLVAGAAALALTSGCELLVSSDIGHGRGARCQEDSDCHALRCIDSVCGGGGGISSGSPLRVGVIYLGDTGSGSKDQWSRAHANGINQAVEELNPTPITLLPITGKFEPADVAEAIDDLVLDGAQVIVSTAPSMAKTVAEKAGANSGVKFLTNGLIAQLSPNHSAYHAEMHRAAYLAGYAASLRSNSSRIGIIGSYVTPATLAYINALALGARKARTDRPTRVMVKWLNRWHAEPDETSERALVAELTDITGYKCDVIAHVTDNGDAVEATLDATLAQWAIGNNLPEACPDAQPDCIGTTSWDWLPLYKSMFQQLSDGTFEQGRQLIDPSRADQNGSITGLRLAENPLGMSLKDRVDSHIQAEGIDKPEWTPFQAGLLYTNDGPSLGGALDNEQLRGMCWYVVGEDRAEPIIVTDVRNAPGTADQVPATGDCAR